MPPRRASARIAAVAADKDKARDVKPKTSKVSKKRAHSPEPEDEDITQKVSDEGEPPKKRPKDSTVSKSKKASKGKGRSNDERVDAEDEAVAQGWCHLIGLMSHKLIDGQEDEGDGVNNEVASSPPAPAPKMVSVKKRGAAPVDPESRFVGKPPLSFTPFSTSVWWLIIT